MTIIRHVMVRGRVQGVGYRAFVEETALRLGLEGWVRNRRDGSVEAVFSGTAIGRRMIEACRRVGGAVEGVDVADGMRIVSRPPAGRAISSPTV